MVDPWEAFQAYQRTAVVLDHFDYEINEVLGGVETEDGERRRVHVMLLAGSDLNSTMSEPGVWSEEDVSMLFIRGKNCHYHGISGFTKVVRTVSRCNRRSPETPAGIFCISSV